MLRGYEIAAPFGLEEWIGWVLHLFEKIWLSRYDTTDPRRKVNNHNTCVVWSCPLSSAPPNLGSCPARGAGSTPAVRILQ